MTTTAGANGGPAHPPTSVRTTTRSRTVPRAYVEMIMGLPFSIHIRGETDPAAERAAVQSVWHELRHADRIFSTYRAGSDINRINRGELTLAHANPMVREVLDLAEQAKSATLGAFDPRYAGVLDPSGIVKGWAAARASGHLKRLGTDWYLNAGGDVLLRASGTPWRVGIEHPADPARLLTVLHLANGAVATSGAAHRGRHIVNPATGLAATGIIQATVCGPDLTWADMLATAIIADPGPLHGSWPLPAGYDFLLVTDHGDHTASAGINALLHSQPPT